MYYFPELELAIFRNFDQFKEINLSNLYLSDIIRLNLFDTTQLSENTVFNLLFSEIYIANDFIYTFSKRNERFIGQIYFTLRLGLANKPIHIYISDFENGENLFEFDSTELDLLNKLRDFKSGNPTSINDINEEDLTTDFSKLSFLHLYYLLGHKDFNKLINFQFNPEENKLRNDLNKIYYLYLLNFAHKRLKKLEDVRDNELIELFIYRKKFNVATDVTNDSFIINNPEPYSLDDITVYLDSKLLERDKDYTLIVDENTQSVTVRFDRSKLDIKPDSFFIVDYRSTQKVTTIRKPSEIYGDISSEDIYGYGR